METVYKPFYDAFEKLGLSESWSFDCLKLDMPQDGHFHGARLLNMESGQYASVAFDPTQAHPLSLVQGLHNSHG